MTQKIIIAGGVALLIAVAYFYAYPKLAERPEPGDYSDVVITLERTICFGVCPDYLLTIYGDGRVVYEGREFVKVTGTQTAQLSQGEIKELIDEFERVGFFSLKDEYTSDTIIDLPTTVTTFTRGAETKRVLNYYGAPQELFELENKIDEVANTKAWIGTCTFEGTCE